MRESSDSPIIFIQNKNEMMHYWNNCSEADLEDDRGEIL